MAASVGTKDDDRGSNALMTVLAFLTLLAAALQALLALWPSRDHMQHRETPRLPPPPSPPATPFEALLDGPDDLLIVRVMHGLGNRLRAYASCACRYRMTPTAGRQRGRRWQCAPSDADGRAAEGRGHARVGGHTERKVAKLGCPNRR